SVGRIALIVTNLLPRSVEPGWIPRISTGDSLLNWLQDPTAGQRPYRVMISRISNAKMTWRCISNERQREGLMVDVVSVTMLSNAGNQNS
ncbi:hypothetical protein QZM41_25435, partial [Burkholderia orbicola]|uniref:hypothetical protein n=1 Tax=Burkholderia cepacia complex TaxID=87882 RepID=UPI001CF464EE